MNFETVYIEEDTREDQTIILRRSLKLDLLCITQNTNPEIKT